MKKLFWHFPIVDSDSRDSVSMLLAELMILQSPLGIRRKLEGNWVHVDLSYTWLRNKSLHFPEFSFVCLSIAAYTGELHRCLPPWYAEDELFTWPRCVTSTPKFGKKIKGGLVTGLPLITVPQAIFLALYDPKLLPRKSCFNHKQAFFLIS